MGPSYEPKYLRARLGHVVAFDHGRLGRLARQLSTICGSICMLLPHFALLIMHAYPVCFPHSHPTIHDKRVKYESTEYRTGGCDYSEAYSTRAINIEIASVKVRRASPIFDNGAAVPSRVSRSNGFSSGCSVPVGHSRFGSQALSFAFRIIRNTNTGTLVFGCISDPRHRVCYPTAASLASRIIGDELFERLAQRRLLMTSQLYRCNIDRDHHNH